MYIYDQTTLAFCQKAEEMAKEILIGCGLNVKRTRLLWKDRLYPIQVVIFEGSELGHFNAPFFSIGLNKKLIYLAKDSVLRDILKHELAHYLTYLHFGEVPSHGKEFKFICDSYGFGQEVSKAQINLEEANDNKEGDLTSEKVLERVKKLLSLSQSSNLHEAELATIKANEILLRHNLSRVPEKKVTIFMDRLLMQKRKDAKMTAIVDIIAHFIVRPVISLGQNACCLEVSGTETNVKLARYVVEFLDRELDRLWDEVKKENSLTGLRAKNSFFLGVAKGFDLKMKESKKSFSVEDQKALVLVEKNLLEETQIIYKRLSKTTSQMQFDPSANALGIERGKKLHIRQGVESKNQKLFLSYGGK